MKGLAIAVSLFVGVPALGWACEGKGEHASYKKITVQELAAAMQKKEKIALYDVNGAETRTKYGMIPGSKGLTHYANYDVAKELPAAKSDHIVFYCGSTECSAAPTAAEKAHKAGYTNVSVLEVGIKGWTEAGQPVTKPQA